MSPAHLVTRDKTGELHAVSNACVRKGAMLWRRKHGNKGPFTWPFHGWSFSNSGKLLTVKDEITTEHPVTFNKLGAYDLTKVVHFQNCKGCLFGRLRADVQSLGPWGHRRCHWPCLPKRPCASRPKKSLLAENVQQSGQWLHLRRVVGEYVNYKRVRCDQQRRATRDAQQLGAAPVHDDERDATGPTPIVDEVTRQSSLRCPLCDRDGASRHRDRALGGGIHQNSGYVH